VQGTWGKGGGGHQFYFASISLSRRRRTPTETPTRIIREPSMRLSLWPYWPGRHSPTKNHRHLPLPPPTPLPLPLPPIHQPPAQSHHFSSGLPSHIGCLQKREYRLRPAFDCKQIGKYGSDPVHALSVLSLPSIAPFAAFAMPRIP